MFISFVLLQGSLIGFECLFYVQLFFCPKIFNFVFYFSFNWANLEHNSISWFFQRNSIDMAMSAAVMHCPSRFRHLVENAYCLLQFFHSDYCLI
jgi:hypothetical protein